jgi:hypothetical protein
MTSVCHLVAKAEPWQVAPESVFNYYTKASEQSTERNGSLKIRENFINIEPRVQIISI